MAHRPAAPSLNRRPGGPFGKRGHAPTAAGGSGGRQGGWVAGGRAVCYHDGAMPPPEQGSTPPTAGNKRWLLRQISVFAGLDQRQLDLVADRARIVEHEKDEIIYAQGTPPDCFYGLVSGRIRVFTGPPGGGKHEVIEVLHRGDYFGMTSILTNEPHSVTTQTINDSILVQIKRPDFEEILKLIPEVAIHLSTTLSRRLRRRDLPVKRVFESTLISVYSARKGSGRTTYAINLAASLHKETGKRVVLLDISPGGDNIVRALGTEKSHAPLQLKGPAFDQARVGSAITRHPSIGFDTLNIAHDANTAGDVTHITPLLSYLTNLYHFVIIDLPDRMDRTVFKALVQADLIHLVCEATAEHLSDTAKMVQELTRTIQQAAARVKVVVNEVSGEVEEMERGRILDWKVYATLPVVQAPTAPGHPMVLAHPDWEYSRAVRRISREIGEVLVGLVLGSGAAMGLSHIGVLKVIERENIPIDIVSGSSIGALLGTFWAAGHSSAELEKLAAEFKTKSSMFKLADPGIPKFGILMGGQVTRFLARHMGDLTFRDLKIPCKVVAVDYARREIVTLDEGPVVPAVRASVSIPAIFDPIKIRGRWLIDGGVLDPVPVNALTQMGVHKVIAVNTLPSPADIHRRYVEMAEERARLAQEAKMHGQLRMFKFHMRQRWWNWVDANIFDVIMHTMQGMEYELAEAACAQADVVLHPTVPRVNWWEFYSVDQLIRRGEEEAEAHLADIKRLVFE
ncbi:MAG: patatin-like phospholipase family protein [Candidatus Omnitrophica bacterium]|nr:patatin-like phospholipase family protein [Candidatus Omnitrophota bacterium]